MRIDTHQHYWRYKPQDFGWISDGMVALKRDCLPADREAQMHFAGVTAAVAVQARSQDQETDYLLKLANENPEILGVVGWTDLRDVALEARLERWMQNSALRGFRHILQDEPDVSAVVDDSAFSRGVATLQRRALTYDVLVFDHQLPRVAAFCARHDKHWLVLDHMGKPAVRHWITNPQSQRRWAASMRELATMPHVMCKLSGAVTETAWQTQSHLSPADVRAIHQCFDLALECFGPLRLMFGSDWPVCQLAAPYDAVFGLAQSWAKSRLTLREQEAFWSGNAVRVYGLSLRELAQ